jgi:hypothetical protein
MSELQKVIGDQTFKSLSDDLDEEDEIESLEIHENHEKKIEGSNSEVQKIICSVGKYCQYLLI